MQKRRLREYWRLLAVTVVTGCFAVTGTVLADTSSSTNYKVTETQFGSGSGRACTGQYCAQASIGDIAVGSAESENYRAEFGFYTSEEPQLQVIIETGEQDLGVLDTTTTASSANMVKVRSYRSSGYIIQLTGNPPSQGTHTLNNLTEPATSQTGIEQFGFNLRDNGTPNIGADPLQIPADEFSFGQASAGYDEPDWYKYISGDTIAHSNVETGETDYTLSMIINISNATPGGKYSGTFSAVVIPIY